MPARTVFNGPQGTFSTEYEAGPSGDIQVVAERPLVPVAASAGQSEFNVTSGASVTLSIPAGATRVLLGIEAFPVRWWDDGKTPTASSGQLLTPPSGDSVYFLLVGASRLSNFKMIGIGGTAVVKASYYA